uniref:Uncharacterized protein n=1 Tax=Sinocyclocheilus grahami TaxID=75366 RepID=A0A672QTQ3_SINGR
MSDLSDFQKGQVIGACLPGASVTLSVLRTTVFIIMAAYTKHGKNSSANKNSGFRPKVNDRDSQTLRRIVSKQLQTTAAKCDSKTSIFTLNVLLLQKLITVHKANIHERATIATTLITNTKAKMRKRWCYDHKTWTFDQTNSSQVKSALLSILPPVQHIHTDNRNCVTLRPLVQIA